MTERLRITQALVSVAFQLLKSCGDLKKAR